MFSGYTTEQYFILFAFAVLILPLSVGLWRLKIASNEMRSIVYYAALAFVLDLIGRIFWLYEIPNLFIGHLSTLTEFLFIANAYRFALKGFIAPKRILAFMIVFAVLAVANTIFLQSLHQYNTYIKILEAVLLISFALTYYYKLAQEMMVEHLEREPFFWVNTGVLIYFSSNLFVFTYSNYLLLYSQQLGIRIWFIHALFFIFFNCILALALWIAPKNSNSPG